MHKKYNFLILLTFVFFTFLILGAGYALAVGDAYFPQDTTVTLDVGNMTIVGGSDADTVTTSNTQVTVTISVGQSFQMTSADRRRLTNDRSIAYTCDSTQSSITIKSILVATTVVITPETTQACGDGSGGAGGSTAATASTSTTPTPTPTPTPTTSPAVSATPTPTSAPVSVSKPTPASRGFVSLAAVSLKDGDVISASGSSDPDVYIVNPHGYKRLFLNPAIFGFYGHLGGFAKVKGTTSVTRDVFVTSGLFRNCETNDKKVYGVETTGEDTGILHWVNTTGDQAVKDDPDFFKKVFCINSNEFNWYKKGTDYTSINQIPDYSRKSVSLSSTPPAVTSGKVKVISSVAWLNVRSSNSTSSAIVVKVLPGQEFIFIDFKNGWYKIQKDGKDLGWIFGKYAVKL